jgi:ferredoxin-NADP reductase
MSNFLCDMKEGEKVSLEGPFGDFILRPPIGDTIFIATGTGIARFRAMRQWLFADGARYQQKQLWLLFGNRIRNRHL